MCMTKEQFDEMMKCPDCRSLFNATEFTLEKMRKRLMRKKENGRTGWDNKSYFREWLFKVSRQSTEIAISSDTIEKAISFNERILDLINYLMFAYIATNQEVNLEARPKFQPKQDN